MDHGTIKQGGHCHLHSLSREIVTVLAGARPSQDEAAVEASLQRIGEHFGVDRVIIAPVARTGAVGAPIRVWVSSDWAAKGLGHGAVLPPMPRSAAHLAQNRALVFSRLDDLSDWPEERETLRRLGIGASAVAILGDAGSYLVAIALDSLRTRIDWPDDVVPDLQVLGALILSTLHRKEIASEIERLRGFAEVVSEISARFVNLPAERIDAEVGNALRRVGEHLDVDLATLSQWTDSSKTGWMISHEWGSDAVGGPHFLGTVIAAEYEWLSARLRKESPVMLSAPDDLPPEAVPERMTFERIGIRSMLAVPYKAEGSVGGHVFLNTVGRQRSWPERIVPQLRLVGQVLASAVEHQKTDIALSRAHTEIRALKDRLEAENLTLREEVRQSFEHEELIGRSPVLQGVRHQVEQVAATDSTVLLVGETGTGKGLVAHEIHAGSRRANQSMITVNCAALPALLIESELFGHEKGAFTGAVGRKIGRFEMAAGGTLFLDEIGDLPLELQAKLLRVLHDREFERVGSSKAMTTDARLIAATNRNLDKLVEQGLFRTDLYFRLHVFPIRMPPLREHPEDIPLLVWYFIGKLRGRLGRRVETISPTAMEKLKAYAWPGNVRELQNVLERAVILSPGSKLELGNIRLVGSPVERPPVAGRDTRKKTLQDAEREHILRALKDCGWRVRGKGGAAERLGLKRTTLNSKMKRLGVRRPAGLTP
jgi:transcriptional regulator with GAF, ATPase, and Fis domain